MKLEIGKDYLLLNTLYPEDRSKDRRVRITGMDRKVIYLETEPPPGDGKGTPLSFSRASMRRLATPFER